MTFFIRLFLLLVFIGVGIASFSALLDSAKVFSVKDGTGVEKFVFSTVVLCVDIYLMTWVLGAWGM